MHAEAHLVYVALGLNPGLWACQETTLPTEPPLWPLLTLGIVFGFLTPIGCVQLWS